MGAAARSLLQSVLVIWITMVTDTTLLVVRNKQSCRLQKALLLENQYANQILKKG
jgi:hypothetical protein